VSFHEGDIVLVWVPDPDDNSCEHPDPALVFRSSATANHVWVVGITSSFQEPIPWYWMRVHSGDDVDPETGLYKDSCLKANWVVNCPLSDVVRRMGFLDPERHSQATTLVWQVLERVKRGEPL
jgi:hypothetical protein